MERSIVTLKRLFSKDIKTEQNNVMQNICLCFPRDTVLLCHLYEHGNSEYF